MFTTAHPVFDPSTLRLVAITDDLRGGVAGLCARAAAAVRGGATMVQVRLKDVSNGTLVEVVRALVAALDVPVLVNDRADIALAAGAAGVHVGTEDVPAVALRRAFGDRLLIGASVGSDAEIANAEGADYVGIGPVFRSSSKVDSGPAIGVAEFARLAQRVARPAVAIGGITPGNIGSLAACGGVGVAAIRSVLSAEDPEAAARAMRSASES
ncbi:MAG: thiamine phosphate synthase [Gemmatimonadaceae bacterium]